MFNIVTIFQNPKLRLVIVTVLVVVVTVSIGIILRKTLTDAKKCDKGQHLDDNNNCVKDCLSGYNNNPTTGECELTCPSGKVDSWSIDNLWKNSTRRCVTPCGTGYCESNDVCEIDSEGKKTCVEKGTAVNDIPADKNGCLPPNTLYPAQYGAPSACCPPPTTPAYGNGQVKCCSTGQKLVGGKCCSLSNICGTECMDSNDVCVNEEPCPANKAIGTPSNWTGCCPHNIVRSDNQNVCKNECLYPKTGETKKLTCGDLPGSSNGTIPQICLNNENTETSQCITKTSDCHTKLPESIPSQVKSTVICSADNKKWWRKSTDAPDAVLKINTGMGTGCNELSCVDNTLDLTGVESDTYQTSVDKKMNHGQLISVTHAKSNKLTGTGTQKMCETTVSCDQLQLTTGSSWPEQVLQKKAGQPAAMLNRDDRALSSLAPTSGNASLLSLWNGGGSIYDGSWTAPSSTTYTTDAVECLPWNNDLPCQFLQSGEWVQYGTPDGITNATSEISKNSKFCKPPSDTQPGKKYKSYIRCKLNNSLDHSTGHTKYSPIYFCTQWGGCCGPAGLPTGPSTCKCLQAASLKEGSCDWRADPELFVVQQGWQSNWKKTPFPGVTTADLGYLSLEPARGPLYPASVTSWEWVKGVVSGATSQIVATYEQNTKAKQEGTLTNSACTDYCASRPSSENEWTWTPTEQQDKAYSKYITSHSKNYNCWDQFPPIGQKTSLGSNDSEAWNLSFAAAVVVMKIDASSITPSSLRKTREKQYIGFKVMTDIDPYRPRLCMVDGGDPINFYYTDGAPLNYVPANFAGQKGYGGGSDGGGFYAGSWSLEALQSWKGTIPSIKGYFRYGTGPTHAGGNMTDNAELVGNPVRAAANGGSFTAFDGHFGNVNGGLTTNHKWDNGGFLTIIQFNPELDPGKPLEGNAYESMIGKWYLVSINGSIEANWRDDAWSGWNYYFSDWHGGGMSTVNFAALQPNGTFSFEKGIGPNGTAPPPGATPIDIKYVFSANPTKLINEDDKFLTGITTKQLVDRVASAGLAADIIQYNQKGWSQMNCFIGGAITEAAKVKAAEAAAKKDPTKEDAAQTAKAKAAALQISAETNKGVTTATYTGPPHVTFDDIDTKYLSLSVFPY